MASLHLKLPSGSSQMDFKQWDSHKVAEWLQRNNFGEYQECFKTHQITGDLLPDLNYSSLREIGVLIVGDRARIIQAIKKLSIQTPTLSPKGLYSDNKRGIREDPRGPKIFLSSSYSRRYNRQRGQSIAEEISSG